MMPRRKRHREAAKILAKLDTPFTCEAGPDGAGMLIITHDCHKPAEWLIYGQPCNGHTVTASGALCHEHTLAACQAIADVATHDPDLTLCCGHPFSYHHINVERIMT